MPSKERGGLSKREFARAGGILKGTTSKIMDTSSAKKAASSSVSKESRSLASAQKEYLKSLNPSKDETAAIQANQNLLMGQEQEARKISNTQGAQGNTVASPFIDRQLGALDDKTQAASIPLKYQIAALQSQREAKSNIAAKKYSFASSRVSAKASNPLDEQYKQIRNESAQLTLDKKKKGGSGGGKYNLENDIDSTISSGKTWEETAQILKKKNVNVNHGSKADILLNKRFAPKKSTDNPYGN